jgi:sensor histidine kinase YesM
LRVHIHVPETLRHLRVPTLLLQPIVENAVKHGIAPERRGGDVVVEARLDETADGPRLVLTVRDSGAGASESEFQRGRGRGVGLRNIERRLAVQYGGSADLDVRSAPGVGTTVVLRIPAERTEAAEPASAGRGR